MMRRAYAIGFIAVVFAGCGPSDQAIQGEVTYGGEPVQDGIIEFHPIEGTKEPSTGGPIRSGRYQIAQGVGPLRGGTYKVVIWATKKTRTIHPILSIPIYKLKTKRVTFRRFTTRSRISR